MKTFKNNIYTQNKIDKINILDNKENNNIGSAKDMKLKIWDEVILTDEWRKKAEENGIKPDNEWFIIGNIKKNDKGEPISYNICSSHPGQLKDIRWDELNVIKNIWK